MRQRLLVAAGGAAILFSLVACGPASSAAAKCGNGPQAPGVRARLTAPQPFATSDVNNLQRRFYAAAATCVTVGAPGGTSLEVRVQGITGPRAAMLLKPGRLQFATWTRRAAGSPAGAQEAITVQPAQVPVADGGSCAGASCAPTGYVPVPLGIENDGVTRATATTDPTTRQRLLALAFSESATTFLAQVSQRLAGSAPGTPENQLAIFLDDRLVSSAAVTGVLSGGTLNVSGGDIETDPHLAGDAAVLINTGRVSAYEVTSQSPL